MEVPLFYIFYNLDRSELIGKSWEYWKNMLPGRPTCTDWPTPYLNRLEATTTAVWNRPKTSPAEIRPARTSARALVPLFDRAALGELPPALLRPRRPPCCRPTCAPSLSLRGFSAEAKSHFSSSHLSSASLCFLYAESSPSRAHPHQALPPMSHRAKRCRSFRLVPDFVSSERAPSSSCRVSKN
jgi:hypothetical protein